MVTEAQPESPNTIDSPKYSETEEDEFKLTNAEFVRSINGIPQLKFKERKVF